MKPLIEFLLCFAAVLLLSLDGCDAEAQTVSAEAVCRVQHAIRWRDAAWGEDMCREVAGAANATKDPIQSFARAINESDLVRLAIRLTLRQDGAVAVDVGFQGVRCVLKGADARAAWRSVRVLTNEQLQLHPPRGRCTNGPARGLTIQQLQNPRTNFEKAEQVFEMHGRDLGGYNGAKTPERQQAYRARIGAIMSALGGVQVKVRGPRMRKLTGQIVEAVSRLVRSKSRAKITIPR